jgi:hypothetical protein
MSITDTAGIAWWVQRLGYGVGERGSILGKAGFAFSYNVQTALGPSNENRDSFVGGKAQFATHLYSTQRLMRGAAVYRHSLTRLHSLGHK